jgi:hypothetical protein
LIRLNESRPIEYLRFQAPLTCHVAS